jgi:magnesium-protoporphyrin O-methyltransferase
VGCCTPHGYARIFGAKAAARDLRRYRRKGLKRDARDALSFARERGVERRTVLEVGGGIGALQVELLRAGAASAVNVELSPEYEPAADELLEAEGVADRVERRFGDVVQSPPDPADVVALIRVVCCYPDADRLVGTAASRTRETLVLTLPRDGAVARAAVAAGNLMLRLGRQEFRTFAHPHAAVVAAAEREGLRLERHEPGLVWHMLGFARFGPGGGGNGDGMDEQPRPF